MNSYLWDKKQQQFLSKFIVSLKSTGEIVMSKKWDI